MPTSTRTRLTCPECGYSGHGFNYIQFFPLATPIVDGTVDLDEVTARPDRMDGDEDRVECPECMRLFPVPDGLTIIPAE